MFDGFFFARFSFHIRTRDRLVFPPYKGSTFRGGFGWAFKRVVCTIKRRKCEDCLLAPECVYTYVFETRPPAGSDVLRNYRSIPRPFVIEPPIDTTRVYKPDEQISFNLVLIGRAVKYLPYFIYTFDDLGKTGIGKGRGRYELAEVRDAGIDVKDTIYRGDKKTLERNYRTVTAEELARPEDADANSVGLEFLTPLRLTMNNDLVVNLEFHHLVRSLLRRISTLSYFHCNTRFEIDFRGLIERAEKVRVVANEMRWFDWERYSARQVVRMKMGGLVGRIDFEGDLGEFMPLLRIGEVIHAGKGTSFGLGRYVIRMM